MNFKEVAPQRARDVRYVDPKLITIKPGFNARLDFDPAKLDALAQSIFENGFYDSCAIECRMENDQLVVVDGERRLRATNLATKKGMVLERGIPVMLVERGTGEAEDVVKMLNKNQGGVPLTATEEANAIGRLVKWGWQAKKIAAHTGMTLSQVNASIALLQTTPETFKAVEEGHVAASTAVKMKTLPVAKQKEMIKTATETKKRVSMPDVQKAQKGLKATIKTEDIQRLLSDMRILSASVTEDFHAGQVDAIEQVLELAK